MPICGGVLVPGPNTRLVTEDMVKAIQPGRCVDVAIDVGVPLRQWISNNHKLFKKYGVVHCKYFICRVRWPDLHLAMQRYAADANKGGRNIEDKRARV